MEWLTMNGKYGIEAGGINSEDGMFDMINLDDVSEKLWNGCYMPLSSVWGLVIDLIHLMTPAH